MGRITFVEHDGSKHDVEFEAGESLMQVAMNNGVPGIDADCGGECACGTCHVILDTGFAESGKASDDEEQMLDLTPEREASSRLSCQVKLTDAMDGLVARLPEFQM